MMSNVGGFVVVGKCVIIEFRITGDRNREYEGENF
jgi:hypothetical protein